MTQKGLTSQEVKNRIEKGQVNGKEDSISRSYQEIIKSNTLTYFNFINIILFLLVVSTGQLRNGLFIIAVISNTFIGIYQEIKAKKLLDAMQLMIAAHVDILRDDSWQSFETSEIVKDDILRLSSGMQVPMDGVVLEGYLEINESMLTGESNPQAKNQEDKIYAGTLIVAGEAIVQATRVGKESTSSKILEQAKTYAPARSVLHMDLEKLLRIVSVIIVPLGILLFFMQYSILHLSWQEAILKTVAAVVGMIPEGLVVLTSVALAVSTIRLAQKKVLIQDLFSIESLARVDTLCLDKTGTITEGKMVVSDVVAVGEASLEEISTIMGSYLNRKEEGNVTEQALKDYFSLNDTYQLKDVLPFSSDRKYAGAVLDAFGSVYIGAIDFLFPNGYPAIEEAKQSLTTQGKRVILLASSKNMELGESLPDDLKPLAWIAIQDVLRPNVKEIMEYFQSQDVTLRLISGDDASTVSALAKQAGIQNADAYVDMSHNERPVSELIEDTMVFGRVLPDQKKEIILALQQKGHTVAMTGDGVNDVPAIKLADVSIAMASGTTAAKNSANIVLLKNDFTQMPNIVLEGRRVINNISRASSMYLVKTVFSMLLMGYVLVTQHAYPFLPIHLTLISAFGVGIPTMILQMEPSFERVKGRFLQKAFGNAIPSAIAVFFTAFLCLYIQQIKHLSDERFHAIFMILTAYIYFYTLYKVYSPPTRLRIGVIVSMMCGLFLVLLLFGDWLSIALSLEDIWLIIPCLVILPLLVSGLRFGYDSCTTYVRGIHAKRKK